MSPASCHQLIISGATTQKSSDDSQRFCGQLKRATLRIFCCEQTLDLMAKANGMADDWIAQTFNIAGSPAPVSHDIERDRAALGALVQLAESRSTLDNAALNALNIPITPWVAWQMGSYVDHIAAKTEHAMEAARLALWAASRSNDVARILANTLSAANVAFYAGQHDLAETLYESILVSPLSAKASDRLGACLGMANLNFAQGDFRDAAYYFDKCLSNAHLILDEEGRRQMFANAVDCYRQCGDVGGALVFLAQVNAELAEKLEKQLAAEPPSLEDRLLIVARMHVLGADDKADQLFAAWDD
jgi:tetratricopeptide (TPR) repeat protein